MESTDDHEERLALLTLLRAPGIGNRTLAPLLAACGSARELARRPPTQAPDGLRTYLAAPDEAGVARDLEWLEGPDRTLLTPGSPAYPPMLGRIPDPPCALFVHGDPALLTLPQLAIVGSRNPTRGGRETARSFARHLAAAGLGVTSGLAEGIDTEAHLGALQAGGATIAVIGTGMDRVYPAANRDLAHRVANEGVMVSEFPVGTPVHPSNFPRRNRIISGLALGTLVVEAAQRSGSLITARLAGEQGREVYAIPGSIHNPLARGCHRLIRDGARLVETADDIVAELAPLLGSLLPVEAGTGSEADVEIDGNDPAAPADHEHARVLDALGYDPVSADSVVERTGLSAAAVSSILLLLELQGHVSSEPGGMFTRLGKSTE